MHTFNQTVPFVTEATPDYSANDLCGGQLQFSISAASRGSRLVRLMLRSIDSFAGVASKLILFDEDPTATTFTENGAFTVNSADLSKILTVIRIAAADWVDDTGIGAGYIMEKELLVPMGLTPTLYGAFIPGATLNLSTTASIEATLGGERD